MRSRNEGPGGCVPWEQFSELLEMARELRLGLRVMTTAYRSLDQSIADPSGEGVEVIGECLQNVARFDEAYPPPELPSLRRPR